MLVGNSLWYLVSQADAMSKFVMFALLVMSVICWTTFVCKLILFRVKKNQLKKVVSQTKGLNAIEQMLAIATAHAGTISGYFLTKTLLFLQSLKKMGNPHAGTMMQNHIDQTVDAIIMHEESYLSILSTCAAVAPLLGLFGTVWGLVHSFLRISEKQSADIATVAPGIAEALMTTLAGLMVAIPAVVMYNILASQLRKIEHKIMRLADHVSIVMQHVLGV